LYVSWPFVGINVYFYFVACRNYTRGLFVELWNLLIYWNSCARSIPRFHGMRNRRALCEISTNQYDTLLEAELCFLSVFEAVFRQTTYYDFV